jgi:hypothetical protein
MSTYRSARSILPLPKTVVPPTPPSSNTSLTGKLSEWNVNRLPVPFARPNDGQSFDFGGSIPIPAETGPPLVFSVVFQFTVPQGKNGIIQRVANVIVGGSFVDFDGTLTWQIALNINSANVSNSLIAPNYNAIKASFGGIQLPSPIAGIPIKENQVVGLLVANSGILPAGQTIAGRFGGFFYPVAEEPPTSGF